MEPQKVAEPTLSQTPPTKLDIPSSKQKSLISVIIIVILLFIVGTIAYYLGQQSYKQKYEELVKKISGQNQRQNLNKNQNLSDNNEVIKPTKPISDDTLDDYQEFNSECGFFVRYPTGWDYDKQEYNQQENPDFNYICVSILSPEYLENIKKSPGPGSAYMGFDVIIRRTKIGSVFKQIVINDLDDYIASERSVIEPPLDINKYQSKNVTIGNKIGKSYLSFGWLQWKNFIFINGNYIYSVSYPVNSDGSSISSYDQEVNSIINSIKFK